MEFKRSVGIQRKQNKLLTMALMIAILALADQNWKKSRLAYKKKTIKEAMCSMII